MLYGMVPVDSIDTGYALKIEHLAVLQNIQMDTVDSSNQSTCCYLADWNKMITAGLWVSIAFQYQPRQQQQRLPRLPFVSLDVAVVGAAADVVVAAAVAVGAGHGPALGLAPAAPVHGNLDIQGEPALWYPASGYRGGLVSLD